MSIELKKCICGNDSPTMTVYERPDNLSVKLTIRCHDPKCAKHVYKEIYMEDIIERNVGYPEIKAEGAELWNAFIEKLEKQEVADG